MTSCRVKQTKIRQCKRQGRDETKPRGGRTCGIRAALVSFKKPTPPKRRREESSQLSTLPSEKSVLPCSLLCISQSNARQKNTKCTELSLALHNILFSTLSLDPSFFNIQAFSVGLRPLARFSLFLLALFVGEQTLPVGQIVRAVGHALIPAIPAADAETTAIILEIRLPRVLLAALVGASLSLAGAGLQGLLGNPLADPYTIGVSSGAAVGAGAAALLGVAGALGGLGQPLCAFGAALASLLLVLALARAGGRLHTASFLLAGIVVVLRELLLDLLQDPRGDEGIGGDGTNGGTTDPHAAQASTRLAAGSQLCRR